MNFDIPYLFAISLDSDRNASSFLLTGFKRENVFISRPGDKEI